MLKNNLSNKKEIEFNLLYQSLINSQIEIIDSPNKTLIGIKGILIYESFKLFHIKTDDNNIKKILKKDVIIKLKFQDKLFKINGKILEGTLITRLKKLK